MILRLNVILTQSRLAGSPLSNSAEWSAVLSASGSEGIE